MFVSYAQNYEDVMLWRALGHVGGGFYIDIGAWLPHQDSVTMAFYERGWNGINVEPDPIVFAKLAACRSRDVNLSLAVGQARGYAWMNSISGTGLSTLDEGLASEYRAAGHVLRRHQVEMVSLDELLATYVPPSQDVHFIKIDVEGFESNIINACAWQHVRPWIVVVEATRPQTQQATHSQWEPHLLQAGYLYAYSDGLNRFYIARERESLMLAFKFPPNIFDDFVLIAQVAVEARLRDLTQTHANNHLATTLGSVQQDWFAEELSRLRMDAALAMQRVIATELDLGHARSRFAAMERSWSWRITWPLRIGLSAVYFVSQAFNPTVSILKRLVPNIIGRLARPLLVALMSLVLRYPGIRGRLARSIARVPTLNKWLVGVAAGGGLVEVPGAAITKLSNLPGAETDRSQLRPSAQRFLDLIDALAEKNTIRK